MAEVALSPQPIGPLAGLHRRFPPGPGRAGAQLSMLASSLGYPLLGTLWSINTTSGIVSSLSGPGGYQGVLQTTAPVQPGNSGGPLVDETGNVIGVIVARLKEPEAQNVNYAVKVDQILPFARNAGVQLRTTDKRGPVDARKIARDGAAYTVPLICLR